MMEVSTIKRAIAQKVIQHTMAAATITLDCYGWHSYAGLLREDLQALEGLESSPLVEAAKDMVKIAIRHDADPAPETYDEARVARDKLGDLMMHTKEI